jgi:hypothetical protein
MKLGVWVVLPKGPLTKAMAKKNKLMTAARKSKANNSSADSVAAFKYHPKGKLFSPNQRSKTEAQKFVEGAGRALRRAAKVARKVAKQHSTPICVWEDGKVVAKKP